MKRYAFSIVYNAEHHFEHNDWISEIASFVDKWSIVGGKAESTGSTSWCKENIGCVDGTSHMLGYIAGIYKNVTTTWVDGVNKDEMVNVALRRLDYSEPVFLWQIDADEQWTEEQMIKAEKELLQNSGDCGCFHANYYVGENLQARGCWGEGNDPNKPLKNAYRRLWLWKGQMFKTHEPPVMENGNGKEILLSPRFNHYAYYFEKDVVFKDKWYGGHEGILERWRSLQGQTEFPRPISELITGPWGKTDTEIVKIEKEV